MVEMPSTDRILALYLHLARASQMRLQPMVRDKLLVLAGIEAESIGLDSISALCRHHVLAHNARHLVRHWPTLAAAVADERFQTYLRRLRRRYSKERAEHMLDSLGIELGRERELYANDLEYAAALLGTQPEAIGDILAQPPERRAGRPMRSSAAGSDRAGPNGAPIAVVRTSRLRDLLVVWGPFAMGLAWLVAAALLSRTFDR